MVTTTLDIVDKVNLVDDERLDIPDTQALQELVSETVVRILGGLFGGTRKPGDSANITVSGSLNTLTFNTATLSATVIGPKAMLLNFRNNVVGDDEGQVVWFDPAEAGQQTTIDLSSYQAASLTPYIWAKRFAIPDDADTRRKWVAGAETTFSLATRQRHRVEFAADAGDHRTTTGDDQWFVVAQIESWTVPVTGSPVIRTWHPFDVGSPISSGLQDTWTLGRLVASVDASSLGVNHAMRLLLRTLMRHRKVDGSVHPLTSSPARGLDDIDAQLDAIADQFDDLGADDVRYHRLVADGAGGWANITGDEMPASSLASIAVTFDGWIIDLEYSIPIKNVQITTAGPSAATAGDVPFDIVVQYAHDPAVVLSKGIKLFVNTMDNLINTTSFVWTPEPAGFPPSGTVIDITAAG